jgi:hypothetical protein
MTAGVIRLKRRIADLQAFDPQSIQQRRAAEVMALEASIEGSLSSVFGHNTVEFYRYSSATTLDHGPPTPYESEFIAVRSGRTGGPRENLSEVRRYLANGKQEAISLLQQAVRELEEEIGDRAGRLLPTSVAEPAPADEPIPDSALTEIRVALDDIKAQLPVINASNAVKAEIHADITQAEAETERPAPRRRFMVLYLESLRDNLAKAAGAGTAAALVAAVGGILAKYFGVF